MVKKNISTMVFLAVILTFVGCRKGKSQYGQAIPDKVGVVKLKEITENPGQYKDKEVVLEGNFGGVCCATDFNYKEGLEMVEVYPKDFPNPKLDKGKPVRIYGIVRSIVKKGESGEEHQVYIEAKGVKAK